MKTLFVLALLICLAAAYKSTWHKKYKCYKPGHFRDPYYCQAFIQCDAHGRAFRLWCPYGTVFNRYAGVCDHKWKKHLCKRGYYPYKKHIYKSKRCKRAGYYKNPWDCASFIQCDDHGKAHYLHCPYGTIFSKRHRVCVHYTHYNKRLCKHGYPHYEYGYKKNPCKYGGLHPYPHDCNKYIQCVHGFPQLMPCPAGLVWNNCLKRCDWYKRKYYKGKYYTRRYYKKCMRCYYKGKYYGK